jgi:aryl carrier-like protein
MAQLVAYIVEQPGHDHTPAQLRALLSPYLPDYMVPTRWVRLVSLPTTANGKLDRLSLPRPDQAEPPLARSFNAPTSSSETRLAAIWASVLHVSQVGVDDDLFDLGADSIHLFQITAQARHQGLPLTAKDLRQHRTVARLCASLAASEAPRPVTSVPSKLSLSQFARGRRPASEPA